ncbi:MAG TPA: hypothetical protein VFR33_14540 [Candidatus Dormibacteraeota bacterium]|nr:hypothetical protein [Candidatus Dormibacteraeota bacterium]
MKRSIGNDDAFDEVEASAYLRDRTHNLCRRHAVRLDHITLWKRRTS